MRDRSKESWKGCIICLSLQLVNSSNVESGFEPRFPGLQRLCPFHCACSPPISDFGLQVGSSHGMISEVSGQHICDKFWQLSLSQAYSTPYPALATGGAVLDPFPSHSALLIHPWVLQMLGNQQFSLFYNIQFYFYFLLFSVYKSYQFWDALLYEQIFSSRNKFYNEVIIFLSTV